MIKNWFKNKNKNKINDLHEQIKDLFSKIVYLEHTISEKDSLIAELKLKQVDKVYVTLDTNGELVTPYTIKNLSDMTLHINGKGYRSISWCDKGGSGKFKYVVSGPNKNISSIIDVSIHFKNWTLCMITISRFPYILSSANEEHILTYNVDTVHAVERVLQRVIGSHVTVEQYSLQKPQ